MDELQSLYEEEDKIKPDEKTSFRYAGFWMRFWAFTFDLIIVFSLTTAFFAPFGHEFKEKEIFLHFSFATVSSLLILYIYFFIMTKLFNQTIGKMILGIKVIRVDGKPLQWTDLLFREVIARTIYNAFPIMNLIYIGVGFTKEKQGLHDYFADTRVILEK